MNNNKPILLVEDDMIDVMTVKRALKEIKISNEIIVADNGESALEILEKIETKPCIILLDLNMPKKDGREALKEIKQDKKFRQIPIVVLTTSKAEEDIVKTYDLGVNSYISKPVTFDGMSKVVKTLDQYWFQIVKLPPKKNGD